jgi:hypothetical protein
VRASIEETTFVLRFRPIDFEPEKTPIAAAVPSTNALGDRAVTY